MKKFTLVKEIANKYNEQEYTYKSGNQSLTFYLHPKKSFEFQIKNSENIKSIELNKIIDAWLEKAMNEGTEKISQININ